MVGKDDRGPKLTVRLKVTGRERKAQPIHSFSITDVKYAFERSSKFKCVL
jgi:hypothetical protein